MPKAASHREGMSDQTVTFTISEYRMLENTMLDNHFLKVDNEELRKNNKELNNAISIMLKKTSKQDKDAVEKNEIIRLQRIRIAQLQNVVRAISNMNK